VPNPNKNNKNIPIEIREHRGRLVHTENHISRIKMVHLHSFRMVRGQSVTLLFKTKLRYWLNSKSKDDNQNKVWLSLSWMRCKMSNRRIASGTTSQI